MNLQFEKNKLYNYLGNRLIDDLKEHNAYIAGGMITSIFSNREINDIDVYFRDEEDMVSFLEKVWKKEKYVATNTNKATLLMYNDVKLQLIHYNYYKTPYDIFKTFDFTVCMGVFDFSTEEFILHEDFLKHNSQKILKFNSDTTYPIISLVRVQKYMEKGYRISKSELINITLTCMTLDINSYDELKEQLGGLYGMDMDELFEDVKDKEFNLKDAIDIISNITLSEKYFEIHEPSAVIDLDTLLDSIIKTPFKAVEINDRLYRIMKNGNLKRTKNKKFAQLIDAKEYTFNLMIYKFVKKCENGELVSYYDKNYVYKLNEQNVADNSRGNNGQLYFNFKNAITSSSYSHEEDKVLLEAIINHEDIVHIDDKVIRVKKAFVVREVPEEEWVNIIDQGIDIKKFVLKSR